MPVCGLRCPDVPPTGGTPVLGAPCLDRELYMPPRIRTSGCLISIVASIVLTVALNLLLRACTG